MILKESYPPYVPYEIEINFENKEELRKKFYRKACNEIAKWLVDNAMIVSEKEIRSIDRESKQGAFRLKASIFIKKPVDFRELDI